VRARKHRACVPMGAGDCLGPLAANTPGIVMPLCLRPVPCQARGAAGPQYMPHLDRTSR
jgi:hypothetical protein